MTEQPSYPDFIARFYDVIYAHLRTVDHDFFMNEILAAKGPVLEVGAGTGRFFLEALQKGADIYGIDSSASMLGRLKSKLDHQHHRRVFVQDARSLAIDKRFNLIVAPFRVFSHLLEVEDQLMALNSINDHLAPGGKFIFDLFVPDLRILQNGIKEETDFDGEYAPGRRVRRVVTAEPDLVSQLNRVTMQLTWDEDDGPKTGTWQMQMRFFFRYELEHLVRRSRLNLVKICGDYEGHDLVPGSKDFVVVCERGT